MRKRNRIGVLGHHGFSWIAYSVFIGIGGLRGQYAYSQKPTPRILPAQKESALPGDLFSEDLKRLAQRRGITFFAEGEPFSIIKGATPPSLDEKLAQEEAVREVADYFDYSFVRQGKIYLLTKRYSNSEDLPEVTPEECRYGLKTIAKLLAPFNPKIPAGTIHGEPMANIARLLSTEQLDRLNKSGLPVPELTPAQHEEVWKLALKFYLQPAADQAEKTYTLLETRNPVDPVFQWKTIYNIHAFGYDTRSVRLNKMQFVTISNSNRIVVTPDGPTEIIVGLETRPDPTDPTILSDQTKQILADKGKSSHTISISEAIAALNRRAGTSGVYQVDPRYAAKHLTLVGTEKLPADVFMRSLATVYGLQVVQNEDRSLLLTHPSVPDVKQLPDLRRALLSAIPAPIYHAITTGVLAARKAYKGLELPVSLNNYNDWEAASHLSAVRRFLYVAEPQVKSQPIEKLALSHLGERERSAFEYISCVNSYAQAGWLADRSAPPYISDFEHIVLTGGIYHNTEGAERFSLSLSYTDPKTGTTSRGVGFSNAILPQ